MSFTVVGIGEVLWDEFPGKRTVGGAPLNFAYHSKQLGADSVVVSGLGDDADGREILEQFKAWSLNSDYLQMHQHPTGKVLVSLSHEGVPSYQICEHVAWDFIESNDSLRSLASRVDCVCFGSLGQRSTVSHKTIIWFLSQLPETCLKVFDINLRQQFYSESILRASLEVANVLKISDEELPVLKDLFDLKGNENEQLETLRESFHLDLIAYTRGSRGSRLVGADERDDFSGCSCELVDTVGAGDSFTATLCMNLLHGASLAEANERANRVAAFVCSNAGATPVFPEELLSHVLKSDH